MAQIVNYKEFQIEVGSAAYERLVKDGLIEPVAGASSDLADLSVAELRERASEAGVEGYSSLKKAELVEAIENAQSGEQLG